MTYLGVLVKIMRPGGGEFGKKSWPGGRGFGRKFWPGGTQSPPLPGGGGGVGQRIERRIITSWSTGKNNFVCGALHRMRRASLPGPENTEKFHQKKSPPPE